MCDLFSCSSVNKKKVRNKNLKKVFYNRNFY